MNLKSEEGYSLDFQRTLIRRLCQCDRGLELGRARPAVPPAGSGETGRNLDFRWNLIVSGFDQIMFSPKLRIGAESLRKFR